MGWATPPRNKRHGTRNAQRAGPRVGGNHRRECGGAFGNMSDSGQTNVWGNVSLRLSVSANPNGIESTSPGLERSDYPGWQKTSDPTLKGLHQTRAPRGYNPFRVGDLCGTASQGSSCLATLGWMMESRWDSPTDTPQASNVAPRRTPFSTDNRGLKPTATGKESLRDLQTPSRSDAMPVAVDFSPRSASAKGASRSDA